MMFPGSAILGPNSINEALFHSIQLIWTNFQEDWKLPFPEHPANMHVMLHVVSPMITVYAICDMTVRCTFPFMDNLPHPQPSTTQLHISGCISNVCWSNFHVPGDSWV